MTEITRVPLQPIAKGALGKLWLGALGAVVLAGGIAWAAMPVMVKVETLEAGEGPSPGMDDVAFVNYKGMLPGGKVFDQGQQQPFPMRGVVPGFTKALMQMQPRGKYRVVIPSELAYGDEDRSDPRTGKVVIPANSDLTFEIELLGSMTMTEFEQRQQMMQMMQMQGGAPGGGAGGGGAGGGGAPGGGAGGAVPVGPEGPPRQPADH